MLFFVHSMLRFFTLSLPPPASAQSTDKPKVGEEAPSVPGQGERSMHVCISVSVLATFVEKESLHSRP